MLELINVNQEVLNTRERVTVDLIKDCQEFIETFEINHELILDTTSIIYRFLKLNHKVPNNLFKFYIAAYYIVLRHPKAFPAHESKKKFCRTFGIQQSSLEYCVEKITGVLGIMKILDGKNYPYFIDLRSDLGFKLTRNIVENEVEKAMMNFLLYHQPINSQLLTESLITKIVFDMNVFPKELFQQFYEIVFDLVENSLIDYNEYVKLQQNYLI